MYAILHIPTGLLLNRPSNYSDDPINKLHIASSKTNTLFYTKKDADKFKRSFLVCLYNVKWSHGTIVKPASKPSFLTKRNRLRSYHMTGYTFETVLDSLKWYPIKVIGTTCFLSSAEEFLVIEAN